MFSPPPAHSKHNVIQRNTHTTHTSSIEHPYTRTHTHAHPAAASLDSALYDLDDVDQSIAVSLSENFAEDWRSLQRWNPAEKKILKKVLRSAPPPPPSSPSMFLICSLHPVPSNNEEDVGGGFYVLGGEKVGVLNNIGVDGGGEKQERGPMLCLVKQFLCFPPSSRLSCPSAFSSLLSFLLPPLSFVRPSSFLCMNTFLYVTFI